MKNFFFKLRFLNTPLRFACILAAFFVLVNPHHTAAQGCILICNDQITVAVPSNGVTELFPYDILEGDPSQNCPNGIFRTQAQISSIWQPATGNIVFDASHTGQTFLCRVMDEVSGNSCWGNVQVVAAPPLLDTVHFQLCANFWEGDRPIKGATLVFQPNNPAFPYSPLLFPLDSSHACTEVTVVLSDYLPGTTFSYGASLPDSSHLNGVDIVDLCKISEHILGINPLSSPYSIIAADVSGSGSITTFDLVQSRQLILGAYNQYPNNTSWRFISDYCVFPNPNNPFQGACASGISSAELAAINGDTAKVIGIKIGDVDGSAQLIGEPVLQTIPADSITLVLPLGQLTPGIPVAVPVKFDKDFDLGGLQVQFSLNPNLVQFDSISDGLMDVNAANLYYAASIGRLRFLSGWYQSVPASADDPLFYIHIKPLVLTDLSDAIKVVHDDPEVRTFATGNNCSVFYTVGSAFSGSVATNTPVLQGLRVQPPSPNPFSENTFLDIDLESAETAVLEVTDLMGRVLYAEEKSLPIGAFRWQIPASAVASGSLGIWRLRISGQMVSGKLVRN